MQSDDSLDILNVNGPFFTDSQGRAVLLRGVNLSGADKLPYFPRLPTHELKGFYESEATVSFVNRPFPLEEADEHLSRLKHWGFNVLRLNVTWEALEHAGPGKYDLEYIEYLIKLLYKLKEYGLRCFIDPHQDVWSRFSGGSGAPGWTLRLIGFEPRHFTQTNAAVLHNTWPNPSDYPKMIWPTNYTKLASATMFTLFFAGKTFAPKCCVDGVNIQDYLQSHYMNAVCALAKEVMNHPELVDRVVLGYDTLNEPNAGFIGIKDIGVLPAEFEMKQGPTPTPFQAMLLGEGHATTVDYYEIGFAGPAKTGARLVDPRGVSAWSDTAVMQPYGLATANQGCIWANHGVWDRVTQTCLVPDYFAKDPVTQKPVSFRPDYWKPFVLRFSEHIRRVHPNAIVFMEPPVTEAPPLMHSADLSDQRVCFAPHFYDGMTLITKKFNRWFNVDYLGVKRGKYLGYVTAVKCGERGIVTCFRNQLELMKEEGEELIGNYPCMIGEVGIPYDMDDKRAYVTGDYSSQIQAMDANMKALESSLVNFTLWNYCPDNNHRWGDQWNGEDLSLYSKPSVLHPARLSLEEKLSDSGKDMSPLDSTKDMPVSPLHDLDEGGRAVEAFCRPYPLKTAGIPLKLSFNRHNGLFYFSYSHATSSVTSLETVFYVPHLHYPSEKQLDIWTSDKNASVKVDWLNQRVTVTCSCDVKHVDKHKVHTVVFKRTGRVSLAAWVQERGSINEDDDFGEKKKRGKWCPSCQVL